MYLGSRPADVARPFLVWFFYPPRERSRERWQHGGIAIRNIAGRDTRARESDAP